MEEDNRGRNQLTQVLAGKQLLNQRLCGMIVSVTVW